MTQLFIGSLLIPRFNSLVKAAIAVETEMVVTAAAAAAVAKVIENESEEAIELVVVEDITCAKLSSLHIEGYTQKP